MTTKSSNTSKIEEIASLVTKVRDFPSPGILFRDISPLLGNYELREAAFDLIAENYKNNKIDCVAGLDARGFIIATALAWRLKCKMVMIRKPSKLPNTISVDYGLEYGKNTLQLQKDSILPGEKVLICDDVLATGGTIIAAQTLIKLVKAEVAGACLVIELDGLPGREKLEKAGIKTFSLLHFPSSEEVQKTTELPPPEVSQFSSLVPPLNDDRIIVFHFPSMVSIAEDICSRFSKYFRLGTINWKCFPDGWFDINFEHLDELKGRNVIFLGSLRDPTKYLQQISMSMVLPRQMIKSLDLFFPFYGPATMERVDEEGVLATAETTAKITTACMPMTRSGPATLHVFDIHALPIRFYFDENVTMDMMSAIPILIDYIVANKKKAKNGESVDADPISCIAFPDEGAAKRFKSSFKGVAAIICAKVRDGNKRTIRIVDRWNWPMEDSHTMDHVLIVDDLVQSGGTLDECRKALITCGAKKVSAYVTHAVFPNEGYKRFFEGGDREGFYRFYTTDTIPETTCQIEGKLPFHVFHIGDTIAKNVLTELNITKNAEPIPSSIVRVYVASTAESKLLAAKKAFEKIYSSNIVKIYGCKAKSMVREQPVGHEETKKGALNRLEHMKLTAVAESKNWSSSDIVFYVALENGIVEDKETKKWKDFCHVEVELFQIGSVVSSLIQEADSDMVEIPSASIMEKVIESSFNMTAGSLMEMKYGWQKDTWHKQVTGIGRSDLMASAIIKAANTIIQSLKGPEFNSSAQS